MTNFSISYFFAFFNSYILLWLQLQLCFFLFISTWENPLGKRIEILNGEIISNFLHIHWMKHRVITICSSRYKILWIEKNSKAIKKWILIFQIILLVVNSVKFICEIVIRTNMCRLYYWLWYQYNQFCTWYNKNVKTFHSTQSYCLVKSIKLCESWFLIGLKLVLTFHPTRNSYYRKPIWTYSYSCHKVFLLHWSMQTVTAYSSYFY